MRFQKSIIPQKSPAARKIHKNHFHYINKFRKIFGVRNFLVRTPTRPPCLTPISNKGNPYYNYDWFQPEWDAWTARRGGAACYVSNPGITLYFVTDNLCSFLKSRTRQPQTVSVFVSVTSESIEFGWLYSGFFCSSCFCTTDPANS